MYPSLTSTLNKGGDNDDDKYTNSELFSNLGSHDELLDRAREVDDDAKPLPDWMSDSSENVLRGSLLPPQLPIRGGNQLAGLEQLLKTAPAGLLQQVRGAQNLQLFILQSWISSFFFFYLWWVFCEGSK